MFISLGDLSMLQQQYPDLYGSGYGQYDLEMEETYDGAGLKLEYHASKTQTFFMLAHTLLDHTIKLLPSVSSDHVVFGADCSVILGASAWSAPATAASGTNSFSEMKSCLRATDTRRTWCSCEVNE